MKIASLLRKKWLLAAVAAAVVGSAAYAFAATLGVTSGTLGAGNVTVGSCTTTAAATYTTGFDNTVTTGHFAVNQVTLNLGSACSAGDQIEVVLEDSSNNALAGFVYTVPSGGGSTTVTVTPTGGADFTAPPDITHSFVADSTTSPATTATTVSASDVNGIAVSAVGAAA